MQDQRIRASGRSDGQATSAASPAAVEKSVMRRSGTGDDALRGSNQTSLRAHNERTVLSLIRRHGALAKSQIARLSGLSPQTASVIMRSLEGSGLVLAGEPQRGRVGQPSVPMRLDPDGAFAFGLKLGRRTSELVLMDFVGRVRDSRVVLYRFPRRDDILQFAEDGVADLRSTLPARLRSRVAGLGVGMPFDLWAWGEANGAEPRESAEWHNFDIRAALEERCGETVFVANDVTAACGAEQAFGQDPAGDYAYFFVGAFVGGGVVADGHLVWGRTGNAGALGSILVENPAGGGLAQLVQVASIHVLERMVEEAGGRGSDLWRREADWSTLGEPLERWLDVAAKGLAQAIVSSSAVYDFERAVIDGSFPEWMRARLVAQTRCVVETLDRKGLSPLAVVEGTIGRSAREVGSASLPFFAKFLLDHRVLLTET